MNYKERRRYEKEEYIDYRRCCYRAGGICTYDSASAAKIKANATYAISGVYTLDIAYCEEYCDFVKSGLFCYTS